MRKQTPSQTVGPFYSIGLTHKPMNVMATDATQGQRIRIEGQVFDGDGVAIPDVMVEIWQANTYGRYNHPDDKQEKPLDPTFTGWGRSGTDEKCFYSFETVKPGPVPGNDESVQAPHVNVVVFARGMLVHAYTRIYFADEPANAGDEGDEGRAAGGLLFLRGGIFRFTDFLRPECKHFVGETRVDGAGR